MKSKPVGLSIDAQRVHTIQHGTIIETSKEHEMSAFVFCEMRASFFSLLKPFEITVINEIYIIYMCVCVCVSAP